MTASHKTMTHDLYTSGAIVPSSGRDEALKQAEWYSLLHKTVQAYTRGESSSLPIETVGSLLQSIHYTAALAALDAGMDDTPLCALYERGRDHLDSYLIKARRLWYLVKTTMLPLDTPCYTEAIEKGGPSFFKTYDPAFFAHETPGVFDYFASVAFSGSGVVWFSSFMEALYWENLFCRRFPLGDVENTLKANGLLGKAVPLNIFEPVFQAAMLHSLLKKEIITLCVKAEDNLRLLCLMRNQTPGEMRLAFQEALIRLTDILHIQSSSFMRLLTENMLALAPRLITARESGSFEKLFPPW